MYVRLNIKPIFTMHQIYLNNIAENLRQRIKENLQPIQEPKIETEVIHGDPIKVIFDYVKQKSISMVALTSHGTSGFRSWAMGSVAEKVVRGVGHPHSSHSDQRRT